MFRLYLNLLEAMRVVSKGTEVNDVDKNSNREIPKQRCYKNKSCL